MSSYELLRRCRERLAPYEVPDYVEFRDMLPNSRVGKLLRRELRGEERRKAALSQPASGRWVQPRRSRDPQGRLRAV